VTFEDVPGVSTADVPDSRDTASLVSNASPGQQGVGRGPEQSSRHLRWSLRQQQSTVPEGEASSTVVASSTLHKRKSLSPVKGSPPPLQLSRCIATQTLVKNGLRVPVEVW